MKNHLHPAKAYLLFEIVRGAGLSITNTSYVPFLLSIGMSYANVARLNAFYWLMIVLAELPTGMLADGRSRLWSIRMGAALGAIASFAYAGGQGFYTALICELVMGIAFAFLSGAQQAWLVDALDHLGEGGKRREIFARAALGRGVGVIFGGLIGAFIATQGLRWAWIAQGATVACAFLISLIYMRDQGEPVHRVSELEALQKSAKILRGHPGLVWAVCAAMIFGLVLPFNHYWTPFFGARIGQSNLGWLWTVMYLALASAGLLVRSGKLIFHGVSGISLSLLLAGLSLAGMGLWPGIAAPVAFLLLHEAARGLYEPTLDLYIQDHVESHYRATYGSLQSFLGRMSYGLILLVVWLLASNQASTSDLIMRIWFISGMLLVLGASLLWLFRPKQKTLV